MRTHLILALAAATTFGATEATATQRHHGTGSAVEHHSDARWGGRVDGRWVGGWRAPGGWDAYRRPVRGSKLPNYWMQPGFVVHNYSNWGLRAPRQGYYWVRYYDDAVMVDRGGQVYRSHYDVDWDRGYSEYRGSEYRGGDYDDGYYYDDGYRADARYGRPRGDVGAEGALTGAVAGGAAGAVIAGPPGALIGAGLGALFGQTVDLAEDLEPQNRYDTYGDEIEYYDDRYSRGGTVPPPAYAPGAGQRRYYQHGACGEQPSCSESDYYRQAGCGQQVRCGQGSGYYMAPATTTTVVIQSAPVVTTTTTTTTTVTESDSSRSHAASGRRRIIKGE